MSLHKHIISLQDGRNYSVQLFDKPQSDYTIPISKYLKNNKYLIVTTPTVYNLYYKSFILKNFKYLQDNMILILDCKGNDKTIEKALLVCQHAQSLQLDKNSALISLGGGNCTDIVTIAASILLRGIGHIKIPTTLVGQVDAGIGIKGAVNFNNKKNYLGCFYPPLTAFIIPQFLKSLPNILLVDGIAEIIKVSIVNDHKLFKHIESNIHDIESIIAKPYNKTAINILKDSINILLNYLKKDLYEIKSYKRELDFGHTFSPVFESFSNYRISHGKAVAMDMALSTMLAKHLNILEPQVCERILSLLCNAGLPIWSEEMDMGICLKAIEESELRRGGKLFLAVPSAIDNICFIENKKILTPEILFESIQSLKIKQRE